LTDLKSIPGYVDVWDEEFVSELDHNRWKLIFDFIESVPDGAALDIGERNPFTEQLEKKFNVKINDTGLVDLDSEKLNGKYKTIFCFEVLEHLMNPLFFMKSCHEVLEENGSMFLSTPLINPDFLRDNEHHFIEYRPKEMKQLFQRSGFAVKKIRVVRHIPKAWLLTGIRPALRYLFFGRNIQVEITKISDNIV